jgi:hypothetical protein
MGFLDGSGDAGGPSKPEGGVPGATHKMFTGGERKDASRVPTADAAARVTGHVSQAAGPQIRKSQGTTVPVRPGPQLVEVDPYPLYGLLLYRGDSVEASELYDRLIVDLGEATGKSTLYLAIGHSGQRNPSFEKNAPAKLRKQFDAFARSYPELVTKVGDEQFHRLRETRELAGLLAVPESELPCFVYLTNPPQGMSNFPTLHFKEAWLSSTARRKAFARKLIAWHKSDPIMPLIKPGRTTNVELAAELRETLHEMSVDVDEAVLHDADEWEGTSPGLPGLKWGADCRWVKRHNTEYTFTLTQAAAMSAIINLSRGGPRELGEETILTEASLDKSGLRIIFKGHAAWGTLLARGQRKGTIRLDLSEP